MRQLRKQAYFKNVRKMPDEEYLDWLCDSLKRTKGIFISPEGLTIEEKAESVIRKISEIKDGG